MAALLPEADPIHKVSIIPRGMALGLTQQLPVDDRYTHSKTFLEAQLSVYMAGRVAELTFLNKITTGAANDFEKATDIARKMVCQYGMSEVGPLYLGERDEMVFLGRELTTQKNFSEHTAEIIDIEVKKIIMRNYQRAEHLIQTHRNILIKIADALLDKEVLNSDEIEKLLDGKELPKKAAAARKKEPVKKAGTKATISAAKAGPKAASTATAKAEKEKQVTNTEKQESEPKTK